MFRCFLALSPDDLVREVCDRAAEAVHRLENSLWGKRSLMRFNHVNPRILDKIYRVSRKKLKRNNG